MTDAKQLTTRERVAHERNLARRLIRGRRASAQESFVQSRARGRNVREALEQMTVRHKHLLEWDQNDRNVGADNLTQMVIAMRTDIAAISDILDGVENHLAEADKLFLIADAYDMILSDSTD